MPLRLPSNSRKLLVASLGVAVVNYVAACSNDDNVTSGNLPAPMDYDAAPTSGNLMAGDPDAFVAPTSGNLMPPTVSDAGDDAADPGDAADTGDAGAITDASNAADAHD